MFSLLIMPFMHIGCFLRKQDYPENPTCDLGKERCQSYNNKGRNTNNTNYNYNNSNNNYSNEQLQLKATKFLRQTFGQLEISAMS